jgi:hypothetical protein
MAPVHSRTSIVRSLVTLALGLLILSLEESRSGAGLFVPRSEGTSATLAAR